MRRDYYTSCRPEVCADDVVQKHIESFIDITSGSEIETPSKYEKITVIYFFLLDYIIYEDV